MGHAVVRALVAPVLAALPIAGAVGAAELSPTSQLYAELARIFKEFHPRLTQLELLAQRSIDTRHAVVLVRATVPDHQLVSDFSRPEAFKQETFGLFVINQASSFISNPEPSQSRWRAVARPDMRADCLRIPRRPDAAPHRYHRRRAA